MSQEPTPPAPATTESAAPAAASATPPPAAASATPLPATLTATKTLLTAGLPETDTSAAETAPQKPGEEGAKPAATDPSAQVPEKPEGYALKFAEGAQIDKPLLGQFQQTAHELGLNNGQAQKLAELYAGHAATQQHKQTEALQSAVKGWEAQIQNSPTFDVDKAAAQRALTAYGSPELYEVINDTLIGSHPAMFKFVAAVGKALAEPGLKAGQSGSGSRTVEQILYPNMK